MGVVSLLGKMGVHTMGSILMIKSTDMAFLRGQMEGNMMASGLMESREALEFTQMPKKTLDMECGMMARDKNGSIMRKNSLNFPTKVE